MSEKSSRQLKLGSLLSYAQMGCGVLITLLYTPLMIRTLGQSEYGLYNTVSSTISMLSILSLGFNSSYIRYYSKYKNDNNRTKENRLNGLFLGIFIIIGAIALSCGLYITYHLELIFDTGLTVDEYKTAKTLMFLLSFHLAISFPMSVFQNIIIAHERFIILKTLGIGRTVLGPLVTIPLLLNGFGSVAIVAVTISVALIIDIVYSYYVLKVLKCRFSFGKVEDKIFQSLFTYTIFIAINMVIDQINWNIDKLLLGRFRGTTGVAIYSVGYTLYQFYQMLSSSISGMFTPRIHSINVKYQNEIETRNRYFTELFIKVGRIQFLILALVSSGVIFFGERFIFYWAGDGYKESYYVAMLLIIPASIALIQNIGIEVQRAENLHQFRSLAYSIMAIINLLLSIVLCQKYGAVGAAIGTALSLVLANGIIMNIYYYKKCGINIPAFWKSISKMSVGLLLPVLFGVTILRLWKTSSLLVLLLQICIYTAIYSISMWFIGLNSFEKELVSSPFRRLRRFCRGNDS